MRALLVSTALALVGLLCVVLFARGTGGGAEAVPVVLFLAGILGMFLRRLFARSANRLGRWRRESSDSGSGDPPPPPRTPPPPRPGPS
jgi:hypothetical protein